MKDSSVILFRGKVYIQVQEVIRLLHLAEEELDIRGRMREAQVCSNIAGAFSEEISTVTLEVEDESSCHRSG